MSLNEEEESVFEEKKGQNPSLLLSRIDRDFLAIFSVSLKFYISVDERENCVIFTKTYIVSWVNFRTALSDDDVSSSNELTAKFFHT